MENNNKKQSPPLPDNILIKETMNSEDYFRIKIEKCLDDIKKDLKHLPCQVPGDNCLQKESIKEIKQDLDKTKKIQEDKIQPLGESYKLLSQKTDNQQSLLENIITMQGNMNIKLDEAKLEVQNTRLEYNKEMSDLKLNLITQLQGIVTTRDTKEKTQDRIMDVVQFLFKVIISILAIYGAFAAVGTAF
jgi:hypothetical protein